MLCNLVPFIYTLSSLPVGFLLINIIIFYILMKLCFGGIPQFLDLKQEPLRLKH